MESVSTAVENFLGDTTSPVPEALRTKLGCADTDLLRLAHVNLRFLERLLCLRWPDGPPRPPTLQLYAFALAIRGWLRQVHIHSAYYKYIVRMLLTAAASSRGGGDGTVHVRSFRFLRGIAGVPSPAPRLLAAALCCIRTMYLS